MHHTAQNSYFVTAVRKHLTGRECVPRSSGISSISKLSSSSSVSPAIIPGSISSMLPRRGGQPYQLTSVARGYALSICAQTNRIHATKVLQTRVWAMALRKTTAIQGDPPPCLKELHTHRFCSPRCNFSISFCRLKEGQAYDPQTPPPL